MTGKRLELIEVGMQVVADYLPAVDVLNIYNRHELEYFVYTWIRERNEQVYRHIGGSGQHIFQSGMENCWLFNVL